MERNKIVKIDSANQTRFQGLTVFNIFDEHANNEKDKYNIYIGKTENYDQMGHYDNSDDSLKFITKNHQIYKLLVVDNWILSQEEMIEKGYFLDSDYKEYQDIKNKIIKSHKEIIPLKFDMNLMVDGAGIEFKYPDYEKSKNVPRSTVEKIYDKYQKEYPESVILLKYGSVCEIMGEKVKEILDKCKGINWDVNQLAPIKSESNIVIQMDDLDKDINELRKVSSIVYLEVDGEHIYVPAHKEEDVNVKLINTKDGKGKSKEINNLIDIRLFEWLLKQGTFDEKSKFRIIDMEKVLPSDNAFANELYREYGDSMMFIDNRTIYSNRNELRITVKEDVDSNNDDDISYAMTWHEIAAVTRRLIQNDTYLTPKDRRMEKTIRQEIKNEQKLISQINQGLFKENKVTDLNEESLSELLGTKPRDFINETQKSIYEEYVRYREQMNKLTTEKMFDRSMEIFFYESLYDVLMLSRNTTPLRPVDYRCLFEDQGQILNNLYEYYLKYEDEKIDNFEDITTLIQNYNNEYHNEIMKLSEQFDIYEFKQSVPDDYKSVGVYLRTLQYAKEHGEEEKFYQSYELNSRCIKDIDMALEKQEDSNMVVSLIKRYGIERVKVVCAMALKNLDKYEKSKLNSEIVDWINGIKTPSKQHVRPIRSKSDPLVLELFASGVKVKDEEVNRRMSILSDEKVVWDYIKTSRKALLKRYEMNSYMRLPMNGDYAGYTYRMFNVRVKPDPENDENVIIRLAKDEQIVCRDKEGNSVTLNLSEFKKEVENKNEGDYVTPKEVYQLILPKESFHSEYARAYRFDIPLNTPYTNRSYYLPKTFCQKQEDETYRIILPNYYKVSLKDNTNSGDVVEIEANEFANLVTNHNTYKEKQPDTWIHTYIPNKAKLGTYEKTVMFKAPSDSSFAGCIYYLPKKLLNEYANEERSSVSVPKTFLIRMLDSEKNTSVELTAEEFVNLIENNTNYNSEYLKPSEYMDGRFSEFEEKLVNNVPTQMKKRNNWVAVRTRLNDDTGKLGKILIDVKTGKHAESDNPETWASFEEACNYARENKADTIAYALDGEDKICCIDIDHCINEDGEFNKTAEDVHALAKDLYMEKSISGTGLHFFGKTDGMNIRTFSKDGTIEFYQKSHFIAITGDTEYPGKLRNIDNTKLGNYLKEKCLARQEWKGAASGIEGLSIMSDREVVDRACSSKAGEIFERLYNGEDLQNNHSNSDMALMNRLAFWCNGDKEQMLRIFATSGLYRPEKSPDYYECTAIKALMETTNRYQKKPKSEIQEKTSEKGDSLKDVDLSFSK